MKMMYIYCRRERCCIMKKIFKFGCGGLIALFVLGMIGAILGGGTDTPTPTQTTSTEDEKIETTAEVETPEEKAAAELKAKQEAEKKAKEEAAAKAKAEEEAKRNSIPREYQSALIKAESYAKTMAMSKAGIYDQLVSEYGERFPKEAAQYAIDNIQYDWKQNALIKAKTYAETMSMSDSAIYDQLISEYGEKFTPEEAQYAIDNLK